MVRLLKVKNSYHPNGSAIHFENTKEPEKKSVAIFNKGVRVNTFILMSAGNWQTPQNTILTRGLYTHRKLAGRDAIVFEYDARSWELIKNMRTQQALI
ncbi:hypothetical protein [Mucilaginibacter sp. PAMB04168]|uniref:hypothetical protein n=1 Tax=Mucilaginibacter sp. PAMB04168 TaxID=3138567 RepID=UPI0031F6ABCA